MSEIRVEVLESKEKWAAIALQWNKLLSDSASQTVFLTHEWMSTWADVYLGSGRLFILLVYEKDKLVGIAPWHIRKADNGTGRLRVIECLGSSESAADYFDVIMMKGYEKIVSNSIYEYLTGPAASEWDLLRLYDHRSNSYFLMYFSEKIKRDGKYAEVTQGSYCPLNMLAGNRENFYAGLSAKRRANFRRELRILEAPGGFKHDSYNREGIEDGIESFAALYKQSEYKDDEKYLLFLSRVAAELSKKDWIQIDILKSNGQAIAGAFHPKYNDSIYGYSIVSDKNFNSKVSLGNVLIGMCMEKAVDDGKKVFDMLKGTEDYKFTWATNVNSSLTLLFYAPRAKCVKEVLWACVKNVIKIVLR